MINSLAPSPFSGDWEYDDERAAFTVAFAAVEYGRRWNGWATPIVTRAVLTAFAERMSTAHGEADTFAWDGDTMRVTDQSHEEVVTIAPDADGNYDLGLLGYTFDTIDDVPALRVIAS